MKPNFYTRKPQKPSGFKTAVAWFGGREFIASLKGTLMYMIYGENMDPRSWMKGNIFPNAERLIVDERIEEIRRQAANTSDETSNQSLDLETSEKIAKDADLPKQISIATKLEWKRRIDDYWKWKIDHFEFWKQFLNGPMSADQKATVDADTDFWFDYISDSGDGQMAVYSVGLLAFSDLWLSEDGTVRFFPNDSNGDTPEFERHSLLPRGYFLFVGGDTAYHTANFPTLVERFQLPLRWAFTDVRKFMYETLTATDLLKASMWTWQKDDRPIADPNDDEKCSDDWDGTIAGTIGGAEFWDTEPLRPLFGIPANHDYYDNIDGFNRQFRRSPYADVFENRSYGDAKGKAYLRIPTFSREQEASYVAIHLPFDWWMFGIDSENVKLDFRQEIFFSEIIRAKPKKLILATPEPTTVFGRKCANDDKTAVYFQALLKDLGIEQPFLHDGKFVVASGEGKNKKYDPFNDKICRLDLSGDVHHYARYWGPKMRNFDSQKFNAHNYASVVAGGGGAFFDSTATLIGTASDDSRNPVSERTQSGRIDRRVSGEIPPQCVFPSAKESIAAHSEPLFDIRNIARGGYIHFAGAVTSALLFALLTGFSNFAGLLCWHSGCEGSGFWDRLKGKFSWFGEPEVVLPVSILFVVFLLLSASTYLIHWFVVGLKRRHADDKIVKDWDGRIKQLLIFSIPFFITITIYVILLLFGSPYLLKPKSAVPANLMIILHLAGAGLIVWLSAEYTNWLAVRAKIMRDREDELFIKKLEDPNFIADHWYLRPVGWLAQNYSYRYFFANALGIIAVFASIFGIAQFGGDNFASVGADFLLIGTIVAVSLGYLILAIGTGAAYLKIPGKVLFALFGAFHAILQISTAILLFYVADWRIAIALSALTILMNGLSIGPIIDGIISGNRMLEGVRQLRAGAWIMRNGGRFGLLSAWILFGAVMLSGPFMSAKIVDSPKSINSYVADLAVSAEERIRTSAPNYRETPIIGRLVKMHGRFSSESIVRFIYYVLALMILGYLGARLARIWFGWYLAVGLLFDGHNNEAGGMARIEGFKHLVRIRVQETKLTVYVIGFEKAVSNIDELQMRLVDKFELHYK